VRELHLCTGILERAGAVLLVASRYPNHGRPLWGLPGGRPRPGELFGTALEREWREETGLAIRVGPLSYVSESFDRATRTHVLNTTFAVHAEGEPRLVGDDAHVVDLAWIARERVCEWVSVPVVREPLLAYLAGDPRRYYGYEDAGITIRFADAP
jgi:8-oxo-dGTP diphosphatase